MTKPGNSDPDEAPEPPVEKTPEKPAAKRPAARPAKKPIMPTAREAAAETTGNPPPGVVRWGFYLVVIGVVIGVLGAIYLLVNRDVLVENQLELDGELTRVEAEQIVTNALWTLIIINVIFGAFQALFGWKAREGQRRARMFVTIATVMVVLFHYLLVPTLFGQLAALVTAIGVALYHLPAARTYYPPRQQFR
ncbi:hypothetical protein [Actinophytocola gossypii]|uniref:Integral membrane protein n=1 Tax=Actinophytocola gossypii TaxID=2812003 RepID=A0ABT2JD09_9PSEU|nr:hypothetical protein [Actinophytocola gossypii]MCT2585661.1 hypothetical protein [Actinophytocola gossypii]